MFAVNQILFVLGVVLFQKSVAQDDEYPQCADWFDYLDSNGNGAITEVEFMNSCEGDDWFGDYTSWGCQGFWDDMVMPFFDWDQDNSLDEEESWMLFCDEEEEEWNDENEDECSAWLTFLDSNGNGDITETEFIENCEVDGWFEDYQGYDCQSFWDEMVLPFFDWDENNSLNEDESWELFCDWAEEDDEEDECWDFVELLDENENGEITQSEFMSACSAEDWFAMDDWTCNSFWVEVVTPFFDWNENNSLDEEESWFLFCEEEEEGPAEDAESCVGTGMTWLGGECQWCGYVNEVCCMDNNAEGGGQCEAGYDCIHGTCLDTEECVDNEYWMDDAGNDCQSEVITEGWCKLYGAEEFQHGSGVENCCICTSVAVDAFEAYLHGMEEEDESFMDSLQSPIVFIGGVAALFLLLGACCVRRMLSKKRDNASNQGYGQVDTMEAEALEGLEGLEEFEEGPEDFED